MSIERGQDQFEYGEILKTPLLQSGELSAAKEIPSPEKLDPEDLFALWQVAKDYCHVKDYIAVAFTQFRPEMIEKLGARGDLLRIVYFTNNYDLNEDIRDILIINPKMINRSSDKQVRIEGCGSIEEGRIGQIVARHDYIDAGGYFWVPGLDSPKYLTLSLNTIASAVLEHEIHHLNGKDASFLGTELLDFSDPLYSGWYNFPKLQRKAWNMIHDFASHIKWKEWLVERKKKLIIVDNNGNYVRDFKRVSSSSKGRR